MRHRFSRRTESSWRQTIGQYRASGWEAAACALGRKNWLFAGNDVAGEHLATLMTLVRSYEANGINPRDYLADVLLRIQTHSLARIDELLPDVWRSAGNLTKTDSG